MSVWTHGYLLYILGYVLLYLAAKIVPALIIGNSFSWIAPIPSPLHFFLHPPLPLLSLKHFFYSLALEDTAGSSCKFFARVLESAVSSRSPRSFYWKMASEAKTWVLGVLVAIGVSAASRRPSYDRIGNMCVCCPMHVYKFLNISVRDHLCLYETRHVLILMSPGQTVSTRVILSLLPLLNCYFPPQH